MRNNILKVPKFPGCAKVYVANHVSIGNELPKWRQMRLTKTKSSVSQQVLFDFDDVDIKLYVFSDAEAMCEVI